MHGSVHFRAAPLIPPQTDHAAMWLQIHNKSLGMSVTVNKYWTVADFRVSFKLDRQMCAFALFGVFHFFNKIQRNFHEA